MGTETRTDTPGGSRMFADAFCPPGADVVANALQDAAWAAITAWRSVQYAFDAVLTPLRTQPPVGRVVRSFERTLQSLWQDLITLSQMAQAVVLFFAL